MALDLIRGLDLWSNQASTDISIYIALLGHTCPYMGDADISATGPVGQSR